MTEKAMAMGSGGATAAAAVTTERERFVATFRDTWALWLGAAALIASPIVELAQQIWSKEQGAHGPIVLATGIWLIARRRDEIAAVSRPGSPWLTALVLVPALLGCLFSRITGWLGVECLCALAALIAVFYYHAGLEAVKLLRFPFIYFLFMFPEPEVLTLPLSRALKLAISAQAVDLLASFGFQVARGGVVIFIDQYELLVAQACSGLNSLMGLSALGVFYSYIRHDGRWRASVPLLAVIPFIAITVNFLRVVLLILITHYLGDGVAQSFIHDFAGIFMFLAAVILMLTADGVITAFRKHLLRSPA